MKNRRPKNEVYTTESDRWVARTSVCDVCDSFKCASLGTAWEPDSIGGMNRRHAEERTSAPPYDWEGDEPQTSKAEVCATATHASVCQQPLRVAHRDAEVRPTEVFQHGVIDADSFALRIKQWSARSS